MKSFTCHHRFNLLIASRAVRIFSSMYPQTFGILILFLCNQYSFFGWGLRHTGRPLLQHSFLFKSSPRFSYCPLEALHLTILAVNGYLVWIHRLPPPLSVVWFISDEEKLSAFMNWKVWRKVQRLCAAGFAAAHIMWWHDWFLSSLLTVVCPLWCTRLYRNLNKTIKTIL